MSPIGILLMLLVITGVAAVLYIGMSKGTPL